MKALKLSLLAAAASLAMAGAAQAQDAPAIDVSFNIGANNDYVFRGISQTDEDPSVFGGVDLTFGGTGYAGVWVSNVDFGDATDAEYDIYAGFKPAVGPVTLDVGVIYYGYLGAPSGADYDYFEGKFAASTTVGPTTIGAAVYYSPDFFGGIDDALYYEANFAVAIPETKFTVGGALGHQALEGPGDYTTWNLGVGFALTDNIGLDLRYFDTDLSGGEDPLSLGDSRIVGSVKLIF